MSGSQLKPRNRNSNTNPNPLVTTITTNLRNGQDILKLLHHRNKNQHRRSNGTWWKWLGILRRNLGKLIVELEVEIGEGNGLGNGPRLGGDVEEKSFVVCEKGRKRLGFLMDVVYPKAFL